MTNITQFPSPPEPPEWMVGPFEEWRVIIEGRCIPRLTAFRDGDDIALVVDGRFSATFPPEMARQAAGLIANAMAVAEGYPWLGATSKAMPFAPLCSELPEGTI